MVEDIARYRPEGDLPVSRVLAQAGYTLARGFHRNFVYRRGTRDRAPEPGADTR
jgi:hypothetical protein